MERYRAAVFNDIHGPYNDKRLTDLVLDIYKDLLRPHDHIIINGDLVDFYTINSYGNKHPDIEESLRSEIDWGLTFLKDLRDKFPTQKIVLMMGNHEYRFDRLLIEAPHFWNLLNLEEMFQLKQLDIECVPYMEYYQFPGARLRAMHSPPSYSVSGARASVLKKLHSYLFACTHRVDYACITTDDNERLECWFNGWMGDIQSYNKSVWAYMKGHATWQHCAGLLDVYDGQFFYQQMKFVDYKTVFNGFRYEG